MAAFPFRKSSKAFFQMKKVFFTRFLTEGFLKFRQAAIENHEKALQTFASSRCRKIFAEIDKKVWTAIPAQVGWSYFFNTSQAMFGAMAGNKKPRALSRVISLSRPMRGTGAPSWGSTGRRRFES